MKVSSSRVIRIITGAFAFFESSAGMTSEMPAGPCCRIAARVLADEDHVLAVDVEPSRK